MNYDDSPLEEVEYREGANATFTCDEGYIDIGVSTTQCFPTGEWKFYSFDCASNNKIIMIFVNNYYFNHIYVNYCK